MTTWLPIDKNINPMQEKEIGGVTVRVSLSPYDVPLAVRGGFDKERDRFVIAFKYLLDEEIEVKALENEEHVSIGVGKESNLLREILIDVNAIKAETVRLDLQVVKKEVEDAIDKWASTSVRSTSIKPQQQQLLNERLAVTKKALETDSGQLVLEELAS